MPSLRSTALAALLAGASLGLASTGCDDPKTPVASRPENAERWFRRAEQDYNDARISDAHDAVQKALAIAPADPEIRMLGGRIALVRLEYGESLRLLDQLPGSEAASMRGRAHWYLGELSSAADELEILLGDPEVRDDWAKGVMTLARSGGGRAPLTVSGEPRAVVEMAHVSDVAPYLVIPVEIDGDEKLALIATGIAEVVVDSAAFAEPTWISLRFRTRRIGTEIEPSPGLEVTDVPALTKDLSGISKEVNAPISALIGVNVLRQLNATLDYGGHQFVVRRDAPQPPPNATKVDVFYGKGGGMVANASLGAADDARAALYVDSSLRFPLALDERGWVKAGLVPGDLAPFPGDPTQKLRGGTVPTLRLGAFRLDQIPGVFGPDVADIERGLRFDIDGVLGAPVLAMYRITFADGGRVVYLEDDSELEQIMSAPPQPGAGPGPLPGPVNEGQPPMPLPQLPGPSLLPGPTK
ncbi:MAG: hypothetical protein IPM79_27165 [Polyangiaceae bacterium]|nr:hypothetical protein [Polyangiaceae bacterium]MBK8941190.1 hypothetical protein [Polyangiaceae bacterium]